MARVVRGFAPGRTELAGNHTDHQGGRVIAGALDSGVAVVVEPNGSGVGRIVSEGFAPVEIGVRDLEPLEGERFTTAALARGVIAGLHASGVECCGFDARVTSAIPAGGGISSSAAFELALACALSELFGQGALSGDPVALAKVGQGAERDYFGKPCGLMDQLAIALGGIAAIDFADEANPAVDRIGFDFGSCGYALCLIDTHCDHSLYADEYAQVPIDMSAVAELFGARGLSQVPEAVFLGRLEDVRRALGDLPALRALHYYREMRLVDGRAQALREGDLHRFIDLTRRSAASSAAYLQNVSTSDRRAQPAMVALALADTLVGEAGAARIHGGGFGGTIQAFVAEERLDAFSRGIDAHLGAGSCRSYRISQKGAHAQCL